MKLSLVIPVYNEAAALQRCLQAIAAQLIMPDEVIVVDNNSTDGSARVAADCSFVKVIQAEPQGVVHARNRGFDAARGEIIARIDADTLLPADWVAHIKAFYHDPTHHRLVFSGGARFYNVRLPRAVSWLYNLLAFDFNRLLLGHPTLWGSNMAMTREQWQAVRASVCSAADQHEDLDLAIHLDQVGYGIYYDRHFPIGAELKRVQADRRELWEYLQWWPRTLRRHGRQSWLLCWLVGVLPLYILALSLAGWDRLSRTPLRVLLGTERV